MRCLVLALCTLSALLAQASPLPAQSLRGQLSRLFVLGGFTEPLRLGGVASLGSSGNAVVINDGFAPDAVQANATILNFLTNWIGGNVAAVPIGSMVGGSTFLIEGGVPVEQPVSPGPIYAERAGSLGQGRLIAGITQTGIEFTSVRGTPLDNLRFNFTHRDAGAGTPAANDVIELRLSLDLDLSATSFFLTYGLSDRVDLGIVVPVVRADLRGTSQAQVIPFGTLEGGQVTAFIAGTPEDPVLSSTQSVAGSATGLGDIATRLKITLLEGPRTGFALLTDVRFPTGDEADLLGAGTVSARALGVFSANLGEFSPHVNLGYQYWESDVTNDAVLATVGFDQVLAPWASFSAGLVSELQVGESVFRLPDPVTIRTPFPRTIRPAEIPDMRDDALSSSFGFKFAPTNGLIATTSILLPVTPGGPRPDLVWNVGLQYVF